VIPAFQTFIDRLERATEPAALSEAMTGFADAFGISRFAYLGFPRQGAQAPLLLSTYPEEWTRRYLSRRYQEIDPVVVGVRSTLMPFTWNGLDPEARSSREQRRLFGEATEFGINCGLTIPIHDGAGGIAALTFASDSRPDALRRTVDAHRHLLHLAAIYFHAHVRRQLEAVIDFDRPHLSPREIACLQWTARGKSSWDIGEILGISRRTVVFHLENAKRKLDAVTLAQAVAAALQHGLIDF